MICLLLLACTWFDRDVPAPEPESHYVAAMELRSAVASGDLDAVHDAARAMDRPEELEGDELDALHAAVGMAIASEDLEEAAFATAVIGRACGDCHAREGAVVSMSAVEGEAHAQAAENMWRGLVRPDQVVFTLGARRWAAAFEPTRAALPTDPAGRSEMYGDALGKCAACHAEDEADQAATP